MKIPFQIPTASRVRAQAMVEFALVMPILMLMLFGIFEVGRMLFVYSAVVNASREAVRYGSAVGLDDDGEIKYKHCAGIRERARRSAYFLNLQDTDIAITYDHGPSTTEFHTCTGDVDPGYFITSGDRILITVTGQYQPYTKLVPWSSRTFVSSSARTILSFVNLGSGSSSAPTSTIGPTSTGTIYPTSTSTFTPTATATVASLTPTATVPVQVATFTPLPSSTPTLVPTSTSTKTSTPTSTSTAIPTSTSTPSSSCSTITASSINYTNNTSVISMTITNPYTDVTVSSVTLVWPNQGGSGSPKTLTLDSANIGTTYWSGINNSTGTATLSPISTLTLPGNNSQSTITFTFVQTYKASSIKGTTTITINFSTPGCSSISKTAN